MANKERERNTKAVRRRTKGLKQIVDSIREDGPMEVMEMQAMLNLSRPASISYARELLAAGIIVAGECREMRGNVKYFVKYELNDDPVLIDEFFSGRWLPDPEKEDPEGRHQDRHGHLLKQIARGIYSTQQRRPCKVVVRRDPMDEAFFGPARKAA